MLQNVKITQKYRQQVWIISRKDTAWHEFQVREKSN